MSRNENKYNLLPRDPFFKKKKNKKNMVRLIHFRPHNNNPNRFGVFWKDKVNRLVIAYKNLIK